MGLFDQILGGIQAADTQHAALYQEVGSLVQQAGGVSGLQQQFEQKGLGGLIAGWISTGPNPAITGEQLLSVVGKDKIMAIASKAGLSEAQVTTGITALLPMVIDHLTPNGTVPNHSSSELDGALGMLKSKLLGS